MRRGLGPLSEYNLFGGRSVLLSGEAGQKSEPGKIKLTPGRLPNTQYSGSDWDPNTMYSEAGNVSVRR